MARVAHASSISEESSSSPKSSCRLLSPPHAYKLEYDRAAEGGEVGVTERANRGAKGGSSDGEVRSGGSVRCTQWLE